MQKWEYKIVRFDVHIASDSASLEVGNFLNRLGQDGWELAGIVSDELGIRAKFVFKRPLD